MGLVGEVDCVAEGEEVGGPALSVIGGVEPVLEGVRRIVWIECIMLGREGY